MVNKQVMEGERAGREGLGRGRTNSYPPQGRFLEGSVQEEGRTGGTLSSGGSREPRCLQKIFTCIRRTGPGALRCQVGTEGCWGP